MTKVVFYGDPKLTGFCIKGHSTNNVDDEMGRLVCSAISSAAYMTANTVTDIIKAKASVSEDDACMVLKVAQPDAMTETVLRGFKLHVEELAKQYNENIKISSEV